MDILEQKNITNKEVNNRWFKTSLDTREDRITEDRSIENKLRQRNKVENTGKKTMRMLTQ